MQSNVASAILALQKRTLNEFRVRDAEILEEALCDLVRNPERIGDTDHLIGSSIARARTKVARRDSIAPIVARIDEQLGENDPTHGAVITPSTHDRLAHELIFARDTLLRGEISAQDQRYLTLVSTGFDASEIAALDHESVPRVRVRLSRARARARGLWSAVA
jgi:hypothetical protein